MFVLFLLRAFLYLKVFVLMKKAIYTSCQKRRKQRSRKRSKSPQLLPPETTAMKECVGLCLPGTVPRDAETARFTVNFFIVAKHT